MKKKVSVFVKGVIIILIMSNSLNLFSQNNFNSTPPMGWEPWNIDHCGNSYQWDNTFHKELADFFVSSGLRDLGYTYLTIECGAHYRDDNGVLQADSVNFPNGFKPVTKYIHERGLKARAYVDAGRGVCCCIDTGSYSYYYVDARQIINWGFDGVKIDWCGGNEMNLDPETQFKEFKRAFDKTGKEAFNIEICCWGLNEPWIWGREAGHMWRTSGDIDLIFGGEWLGGKWEALLRNIDENRHPNPKYVGPGKGWNYADMLVVGLPGGLTEREERTQFSMWSIMASPLILGNDVFNMSEHTKNTIMNKEIIAINQDKLGIQGRVVKEYKNGVLQVWSKPLIDSSVAVALFNRSENDDKITVNFHDIKMPTKCKVRDIWNDKNFANVKNSFSSKVKAHETIILKITPIN